MDMSGRFVPTVDLTRDSDGTHSHMSDIPLQLPASANAPSNNAALVTVSQVGRDLMQKKCSQSLSVAKSEWEIPWQ